MPLKRHHPDVTFSGNKLTPDELDQDLQYVILNPSVDPVYVGTQTGTQTVSAALGIINERLDYPRTLVGAIAAASGSSRGGDITISGYDQFGNAIEETISVSAANGGGTTNGTKVFARVTAGTVEFSAGDPGAGTARLGVGIGTSATLPVFGLPAKLGASTDIKNVNWIDDGTGKSHALTADLVNHGVVLNVAGGIAAADSFVITYRSTFNASADGDIAKT